MLYARNENFRSVLNMHFQLRKEKNAKYSLRKYAKDLGLSPSRLSEVLKGRYGLSRGAAYELAQKLAFDVQATNYFCDLVESEHARDARLRILAKQRLEKVHHHYHLVSMAYYQFISEWFYFAILELTHLRGFKLSAKWIAARLGIELSKAELAIETLQKLGMLKKNANGKWVSTFEFFASPTEVSSEAIRNSQKQILQKAIRAIDQLGISERDFSNIQLAVDSSQLAEAKQAIKEFRRGFDQRFGAKETKDRIFCLAVQFFPLDIAAEDAAQAISGSS